MHEENSVKRIKHFIFNQKDQIGKGYSSVVYKGTHEQTYEEVAVKVVELAKVKNEVERYLLNNQMRALRKLNHSNVLKCHDVLMTKNNLYLVTEFCKGGDLLETLKKRGRLPETHALQICRDIAQGYCYIEQNQILHRDLKTANVFLSDGVAKIADFGFCEFQGPKEPRPQMHYNVGSPAYMSPQAYRETHYSSKSDVWSIGIILFELLVGQTPYKRNQYQELASNLTAGILPIPNDIQLSDATRSILVACFRERLVERATPKRLLEMLTSEIIRKRATSQNNLMFVNQPPRLEPQVVFDSNGHASPPPSVQQKNLMDMSVVHELPSGNSSNQNEKLRSYIEYIMFLYRFVKMAGEVAALPCKQWVYHSLAIVFRNRRQIYDEVEPLLGICDPVLIKEFEFLRSRFQQLQTDHFQVLDPILKSNLAVFKSDQSMNVYLNHIRMAVRELDKFLTNTSQQVGMIYDYLLLYYEFLSLQLQNLSVHELCRLSSLGDLMKEKPKPLKEAHVNLLRLKRSLMSI